MASRRYNQVGEVRELELCADGAELPGYRVVVAAASVGPIVAAAGGFLCDRAREGWTVSVLLAGSCDVRPLAILGVSDHRVVDEREDLGSIISGLPRETTVMIGSDLLGADARARDGLGEFAQSAYGAVRVWGRQPEAEIGTGLEPDPYELSPAAIAFKTHALRAAGTAGMVEPVEALYRVRPDTYRRFYTV